MFGFFENTSADCPVNEESRVWIEKAFTWLVDAFGQEHVWNVKIRIPEFEDFPIEYDGNLDAAYKTLDIVARQMDVDPDHIALTIYTEGATAFKSGRGAILTQPVEGEKYSGGLYWGRNPEDNKYHIGLEATRLRNPTATIAALAHEIAHIKLLGEGRLQANNEPLTDLVPVIYGLGIFNANAAFQFETNRYGKQWSNMGYLSQMEWGYALALFAYLRGENEPEWHKYLTKSIASDFRQGQRFIYANEARLFEDVN